MAAGIGIDRGWQHIYDPAAQHAAIVPLWPRPAWPPWWTSSRPFWTPFVSPPPVAWVVAPLNVLPEPAAVAVWLILMTAAIVATALLIAPERKAVPLYLLPLVLTWVTALSIVSGNITPLMGLGLALCWWFAERGRPIAAGIALAFASMKPQAMFAVVPLLLLADQRKLLLAWLLTLAALVAASLATLQSTGIGDLLNLTKVVAALPGPHELSAASIAGSAAIFGLLAAAIAALAAVATVRRRRQGTAIPIAAGIVVSLLLSPYLNLEDFVLLIPAALLLIRLRLGIVIDVLAVALVLSATPASQGIVLPEVVLGVLLLAVLAAGPSSRRLLSRAPAAGAPGAAPVPRTPSRAG